MLRRALSRSISWRSTRRIRSIFLSCNIRSGFGAIDSKLALGGAVENPARFSADNCIEDCESRRAKEGRLIELKDTSGRLRIWLF